MTANKKSTAKGKKKSTASRSQATGKNSAVRKSASASKSSKSSPRDKKSSFREESKASTTVAKNETVILITVLVSILLFLSNFHIIGKAGELLSGIQFGLFGSLAYIFPVLLFVTVLFCISNKGNSGVWLKILALFFAVIALGGIIHLFAGSIGDKIEVAELYENGNGGGLLGGLFASLLVKVTGNIGAFLIMTVVLILCIVYITEKSFVGFVKKGGSKAYEHAKADAVKLRSQRDARTEERRKIKEAAKQAEQRAREQALYSGEAPVWEKPADSEPDINYYSGDGLKGPFVSKAKSPFSVESNFPYQAEEEGIGSSYAADEPYVEDGILLETQKQIAESVIQIQKKSVDQFKTPEDHLGSAPVKLFDLNNYPVHKAQEEAEDYTVSDEVKDAIDKANRLLTAREKEEKKVCDPVPETAACEELYDDVTLSRFYEMDEVPGMPAEEERADQISYDNNELETLLESVSGSADLQEASDESLYDAAYTPDHTAAEDPDNASSEDPFERRVITSSGKVIPSDRDIVRERMAQKAKESETAQLKEEAGKNMHTQTYRIPPVNLMERGNSTQQTSDAEYRATAMKLQETLKNFGIAVTVTDISIGPTVTRYELHPELGVKVNRILALSNDIQLALAAPSLRIEAPIPGKAAIGIEVPNREKVTVKLRDIIESRSFKDSHAAIAFPIGKDIAGADIVADLAKMPHLLIAGATGSGKSVCINTLIMGILYKYGPAQVNMIMIDPKMVELPVYNGIPHLLIPVVTDVKKATGALNWAVAEMEDRYRKFEEIGAKDIISYNSHMEAARKAMQAEGRTEQLPQNMPYIVIIIDELADMMMQCKADVEPAIVRISQLARAAGMHLVIATQRPSVNVITGLIKANIPSRLALAVSSGVDSKTILDGVGAEKLLGHGDMLFAPQSAPKPLRAQGAFISEEEIQRVTDYIRKQNFTPCANESNSIEKVLNREPSAEEAGNERDELFAQAGRYIIDKDKASIGNLQRAFRIGFNRAARIMDQLAEAGVVGPEQGTKPREVLVTMEEFENMI